MAVRKDCQAEVRPLHPVHFSNFFIIAAPILAEGWKTFCFPETKKCDFCIFNRNKWVLSQYIHCND